MKAISPVQRGNVMITWRTFSPAAFMRAFLRTEASGGLVLIAMAGAAIVIANSPAAPAYFALLTMSFGTLTILHWINDALMAAFFLLVGLEIKREFISGELATWSDRTLPGVAALGGMIAPATIYVAANWHGALRGWAIPTATDIAFALGVLSLLGRRVPLALKVFLTALAIIDDLAAVLIIAVLYTADLNSLALAWITAVFLVLVTLNIVGVTRLAPYLLIGFALWFFMLKSGVHATVAGVLLALTVPLKIETSDSRPSPLLRLEHSLHPWVTLLIVPVFSFANAGVSFAAFTFGSLRDPVLLGGALGLFIGKQVGIFSFAWLAIRLGIAELPTGTTWRQLYGAALLCGIGFTMSLFIGLLAFAGQPQLQDQTKLGVLFGSVLSAFAGAMVLGRVSPAQSRRR